jgi:hypothetical protein
VIRRGQNRFGAESAGGLLHPDGVGRDDHAVCGLRELGALVDVLDQGLAGACCENLLGEACGAEAGGNEMVGMAATGFE